MKAASREFFQRYLPVGAIAVVFLLGFQTLSPFLPALLWSLFVSVAIFHLYNNLAGWLGGKRSMATLITVVVLVLLVLLPMLLLLRSIISVLPELAVLIVEERSLEKIGLSLPASMPPTWQALSLSLSHIFFSDFNMKQKL